MEIIGKSGVEGTGPKISETRSVADFTKVSGNSAITADIKFGAKASLEVEAQKNILPLILTRVEDGELIVETRDSLSTDEGMTVHIVMKDLQGDKASGAAHVSIAPLTAKNLSAQADGASTIDFQGKADRVQFTAGGASKINAEKLVVADAGVDANGASSIKLGDVKTLSAEANGASTVTYGGKPTISKNEANGASSIHATN